jgi:hypothetical protein
MRCDALRCAQAPASAHDPPRVCVALLPAGGAAARPDTRELLSVVAGAGWSLRCVEYALGSAHGALLVQARCAGRQRPQRLPWRALPCARC